MNKPGNNNIKYFLYARKSSESEDRQIQSIDDQVDRLKQMAKLNSWSIKEVLTEAHSAKHPYARPIFNTLLDRIEKGEANGILCWQINRLSRNPVDSARIQWLLQSGVIQSIQTIDGERKPTDNAVLWSVEAGVANQFILDHIKNVRRGMESKLAKGWLPGRPPIGYLNDPVARTIIPDPDRFVLVRRIWELILTHQYSVKQVRRMAAGWGLRTRKTRHTGGVPIGMTALYSALTNPFYCGIIRFNGTDFRGNHTPMVTIEEFDRVQGILGRPFLTRLKLHEFIYRGVFRCGECGCLLTGERKQKRIKSTGLIKDYTYYHCTRKKPTIECTQRGGLREEDITRQITETLGMYKIPQELFSAAVHEIQNSQLKENQVNTMKLQAAQGALDTLIKQISNLTGMRYRDHIDDAQFLREKEKLDRGKIRFELLIQQYSKTKESGDELVLRALAFAANAQDMFINGPAEMKRDIIRGLCSNPTALNKKLNIQAAEWLEALRVDRLAPETEYERLEPPEKPLFKAQESTFAYNFSEWWTQAYVIRTKLARIDEYIYIPKLRNKKLANNPHQKL